VASDPFDILGVPARFDLESREIERAYLERSVRLHPDLARGDPDAARGMAELNRAKRIVADPEKRADALLVRLGGPRREEEKGLPAGFLMEMMEVREAVEGAVGSGDPAQRAKWEAWAEERRREAISEVGGMFTELWGEEHRFPKAETGGTGPGRDALRDIRVRLNAWRYIERLIEQLDPGYDPARADFESRE
jgi:molecular chaperone HscB